MKKLLALSMIFCLLFSFALADAAAFDVTSSQWQTAASETIREYLGTEAAFRQEGDTLTVSGEGLCDLTAAVTDDRITAVSISADIALSSMTSDAGPLGVSIVVAVMSMARAENAPINLNETVAVLSSLTEAVMATSADENGRLETSLSLCGHRLQVTVQNMEGDTRWLVTYCP
ncbi:MAG: hypothetical protein Q4C54_07330 [Clostridia bacterium]|nr:hypothetical protein [Clostridia bacterium]